MTANEKAAPGDGAALPTLNADYQGNGFSPYQASELAKRGISVQTAWTAGVRAAHTVDQLPADFQVYGERAVPALVFPYTAPDGTTVLQLRPDTPFTIGEDPKPRKYLSPKGTRLPLNTVRPNADASTVLIVEGTCQALAAGKYAPDDVAVYGISGCTMWQNKGTPVRGLAGVVRDRDVVFAFDADAEHNADVRQQAIKLAAQLSAMGARSVRRADNGGGGSEGLDDVLGSLPEDQRGIRLAEVVHRARLALAPWTVDVEQELYRLAVKAEAVRQFAVRQAGELAGPSSRLLVDLLAEEDTEAVFRIANLWPMGGNVVLAAQRKAGKTTLMGNAIRCLVDGDTFLANGEPFAVSGEGIYSTARLTGEESLFLVDLELDERTLRRWLRDQGIRDTGRAHVAALRGRAAEFNITEEAGRVHWADYLRSLHVRVLIVDPLAPLMAAHDVEENDNAGVAKLLNGLDALKAAAGITELMVVHHMGHNGERSRGASRLRDWPDVEWRLVREEAAQGKEPPPNAARFFSAEGRDVAVTETQLAFDKVTRRLSVAGGNRTQYAAAKHEPTVVAIVEKSPGINSGDLDSALQRDGVDRTPGRKARDAALANDTIHTHKGLKNANLYYPGARHPDTCPLCRANE